MGQGFLSPEGRMTTSLSYDCRLYMPQSSYDVLGRSQLDKIKLRIPEERAVQKPQR